MVGRPTSEYVPTSDEIKAAANTSGWTPGDYSDHEAGYDEADMSVIEFLGEPVRVTDGGEVEEEFGGLLTGEEPYDTREEEEPDIMTDGGVPEGERAIQADGARDTRAEIYDHMTGMYGEKASTGFSPDEPSGSRERDYSDHGDYTGEGAEIAAEFLGF